MKTNKTLFEEQIAMYEHLQRKFDMDDIEFELTEYPETYVEKFGIDKNPVTETELAEMASLYRHYINNDDVWTWATNYAIYTVLERRQNTEGR